MDDTLLVIFLNEAVFLRDMLNFICVYLATIFSRCSIISFIILIVVMILRATVLKRAVFLKGLSWGVFLLVPFFGRLRIYYEGLWKGWRLFMPFFLCQELSITHTWLRTVYFAGIITIIIYKARTYHAMKRLFRDIKETDLYGYKVCITDMEVSPCAFGLFKPRIIIPQSMVERLPGGKIKTIIVHEKTHIALGHLWIFFAWEILSAVLWINPFLMLSAGKLREDMEQICDRVTIQKSLEDPVEYGKLILRTSVLLSSDAVKLPAMLAGGYDYNKFKDRIINIRDFSPCSKNKAAGLIAVSCMALILSFAAVHFASYSKYEVLPDVTVGGEYGEVYADSETVTASGIFIRTKDGISVDSKKLRRILPEDFPRDKYVYFYYDVIMKIPGIGGGGNCAWLSDVPESGVVPLTIGERNTRDKIAIWLMKVI